MRSPTTAVDSIVPLYPCGTAGPMPQMIAIEASTFDGPVAGVNNIVSSNVPVAIGDKILVGVGWDSNTPGGPVISGVADSGANAYAAASNQASDGAVVKAQWYVATAGAAGNVAVTVTFSANVAFALMKVYVLSGAAGVEDEAVGGGAGVAASTAPLTATQDSALFGLVYRFGAVNTTWTVPAVEDDDGQELTDAHELAVAAGNYSLAATQPNVNWAAAMVSVDAAP